MLNFLTFYKLYKYWKSIIYNIRIVLQKGIDIILMTYRCRGKCYPNENQLKDFILSIVICIFILILQY